MSRKHEKPHFDKDSLVSSSHQCFEFGQSLLWLAQYSAAKTNGEMTDGLPLMDPANTLSLAARTRWRAEAIVDEAHGGPGVSAPAEVEYLIQSLVVVSLDLLEQSRFLANLAGRVKPGRPRHAASAWFEVMRGPSDGRIKRPRGRPRAVELSDAELLARFAEHARDGRTLKDIAVQIAADLLGQRNKHSVGRRLEESAARLLNRRRTVLRKQREKDGKNSPN